MDDRGFIRALKDNEQPRSNEIVITKRSRDRLKHMSMRQRVKFRSLVSKGMSEDEAIAQLRGQRAS